MKKLIVVALLLCPIAKADSLKVITQDIKQGSALSLHNDVAQDLAENILAAQIVASYGGPESLADSIISVLKAISLEKGFGLKFCDDFNCEIVWATSNLAIDPNAGAGFSPTALDFGEVPVRTPEPATLLLLLAGLAVISRKKS